jgi:hypothetical protein
VPGRLLRPSSGGVKSVETQEIGKDLVGRDSTQANFLYPGRRLRSYSPEFSPQLPLDRIPALVVCDL